MRSLVLVPLLGLLACDPQPTTLSEERRLHGEPRVDATDGEAKRNMGGRATRGDEGELPPVAQRDAADAGAPATGEPLPDVRQPVAGIISEIADALSTPKQPRSSERDASTDRDDATAPEGAATRDGAAALPGKAEQPNVREGAASADVLTVAGAVKQGGLVVAKVPPGTTKVSFRGHRVVVAPDGSFLVAFAYDAPPEQKLAIVPPNGERFEHVFSVGQRTYVEEKIDGLPEEEIEPKDPERKKRLAEEQRRIAKARETYSKEPHYLDGFVWPARGPISSTYGRERSYDGEKGGRHWGVDIAVPVGTPVKAPAGGTVTYAAANVPLSGTLLIIDHGHGLSSSLLHLSEIGVNVGDEVKKGEVIGRSGSTGRATGAHLDWRMNLFQVPIDPELVIASPPRP